MSRECPKIVLLGAGSFFTLRLFVDCFLIEELERGEAVLVDIDAERLALSEQVLRRQAEALGREAWTITATTERAEALDGADFVFNTIEVSGRECVRFDNDIPLTYGIDQCIGDTIGPGGIMKALRTAPAFLDIVDDAARLCPGAPILNYTNPMSILTLAATRRSGAPVIGLCHSVQYTSERLAGFMGVPYEELDYQCGGINHMAWFTRLEHRGEDVYPKLFAAMDDPEIYEKDPIRFEMMREFGCFVTESSGHFSEYVPYFRKRPELIERYCRSGYRGESAFYPNNWPSWRERNDRLRREMLEGKTPMPLTRSIEYAADIVRALLFNVPVTVFCSVENTGLIPNLPQTGVVETPVLFDGRGAQPTYFGPLPEQLAALCRSNMAVYELCAQGLLNEDREAIIHALMLDPLSAAVCSPAEIRSMAGELFEAERDFIPEWLF